MSELTVGMKVRALDPLRRKLIDESRKAEGEIKWISDDGEFVGVILKKSRSAFQFSSKLWVPIEEPVEGS